MRGSRGGGGAGGPDLPSPENHKNIELLRNSGPDPLKFSELPSQHSTLGHHRHANETPFRGVLLAGRWWPAYGDILILSPLKKRKTLSEFGSRSDPNGIQERMFRLNIWAWDRNHAKHKYCRISDFVVQKPMRKQNNECMFITTCEGQQMIIRLKSLRSFCHVHLQCMTAGSSRMSLA